MSIVPEYLIAKRKNADILSLRWFYFISHNFRNFRNPNFQNWVRAIGYSIIRFFSDIRNQIELFLIISGT